MDRLLPFVWTTKPSDGAVISAAGIALMVGLNAAVLATYAAVITFVVKVVV